MINIRGHLYTMFFSVAVITMLFPTTSSLAQNPKDFSLSELALIHVENVSHLKLIGELTYEREEFPSDMYSKNVDITNFSFSPDGNLFAAAIGRSVYLWNLNTMNAIVIDTSDENEIYLPRPFVHFTDDGKNLVFNKSHSIVVWDIEKQIEHRSISIEYEGVNSNYFVPVPLALHGSTIVARLGVSGDVYHEKCERIQRKDSRCLPIFIIDLETEVISYIFPDFSGNGWDEVTLSPDGKLLAYASGRDVLLWNITSGEQIAAIEMDLGNDATTPYPLTNVIFSPDGQKIYANPFGIYGEITVASLDDQKVVGLAPGALHALSSDGTLIINVASVASFQVLEVYSGNVLVNVPIEREPFLARFSPDGTLVVTTYGGGVIQLWGVPATD